MAFNHMLVLYYDNFPTPDSDGVYSIPWDELNDSINGVKAVLDERGYGYEDIIFDTNVQVYVLLKDEISDVDLSDVREACEGVFTVRSMDENQRDGV